MDRYGVREIKGQEQKKLRFGIPKRRSVFIVQSRTYADPEIPFAMRVGGGKGLNLKLYIIYV